MKEKSVLNHFLFSVKSAYLTHTNGSQDFGGGVTLEER